MRVRYGRAFVDRTHRLVTAWQRIGIAAAIPARRCKQRRKQRHEQSEDGERYSLFTEPVFHRRSPFFSTASARRCSPPAACLQSDKHFYFYYIYNNILRELFQLFLRFFLIFSVVFFSFFALSEIDFFSVFFVIFTKFFFSAKFCDRFCVTIKTRHPTFSDHRKINKSAYKSIIDVFSFLSGR